MAYHDENGKITIDEVAANKDARRLREAAGILKESRASIQSLQRQAGEMQGLTATAIQEKSMEMVKKLDQMIGKLESTADYIQKVVANYRRKDEELKRLIQAQKIVTEIGSSAKSTSASVQNIGKSAGSGAAKAAEAAKESFSKDAAQKAVQSMLEGFGSFFKK